MNHITDNSTHKSPIRQNVSTDVKYHFHKKKHNYIQTVKSCYKFKKKILTNFSPISGHLWLSSEPLGDLHKNCSCEGVFSPFALQFLILLARLHMRWYFSDNDTGRWDASISTRCPFIFGDLNYRAAP